MNSDASNPALIGVDWGTSSLRAYLIGKQGEVLDSQSTDDGIMQIPDRQFEAALHRVIDPWITGQRLPLLASGMITSRNGWLETPYIEAPTGIDKLSDSLLPLSLDNGLTLHCIAGVSIDHNDTPDVMRGEETQVAGAVAGGMDNGILVMPGTHSKWVTVRNGGIADFETYMTGEIFAALRKHTILGTLMKNGNFCKQAFSDGLVTGSKSNSKLLHSLFSVRTLPLFQKMDSSKVADYLSGMLIGAEIAGATCNRSNEDSVTILGRSDLSERYAIAIQTLGLTCERLADNSIAKGYLGIATAAGMLT